MQQSSRSAVPSKQRRDAFTATFEVLRPQGVFIPNICDYGHHDLMTWAASLA